MLIIEATALRANELESLLWGDVDDARQRVRVRASTNHSRRARWVQIPGDLWSRMLALVPREDRDPRTPVFEGATQERMRTDLQRACKATGTPLFALHALRHRRLSLWHRDGVPAREAAHRAGHSRASLTLDVYTHVLLDDREVDRALILA